MLDVENVGNHEKEDDTLRVTVLFSGGKDSTLALHRVSKEHEIVSLLTVKPNRQDSWMFHHPCINLTPLQAEAMQLPHRTVETEGVKEEELEDLQTALTGLREELGIEGVVSGAIASQYQRTRIERICGKIGLKPLNPLWGEDPETLLKETVDLGFETYFTAVSAQGFTEEWLNRKLDGGAIEELKKLNRKYGINISLEGGEGETLVTDAPPFKKRIELLEVRKVWEGDSGYLLVLRAGLKNKN
jgi:diphthine-ammonia ligase